MQRVIQAVKPFYSPDIDKGAKWSNEIDEALEGTRFGIICLTPDNLESSWIHYEAGALSKTKDASIWTFLLELKPSDVKQPLGRFQHTLAEKVDILKMLKSINAKLVEAGGAQLRESLLEEIFEESWTKLETRLNQAKESIKTVTNDENSKPIEPTRNEIDKLDEILEILRTMQREPQEVNAIPRAGKVRPFLNRSSFDDDVFSSVSFELPIPKESALSEIEAILNSIITTFGDSEITTSETENGYKFNVHLSNPKSHHNLSEDMKFVAEGFGYKRPSMKLKR